jgi:lysophospholipase L1-like esterase
MSRKLLPAALLMIMASALLALFVLFQPQIRQPYLRPAKVRVGYIGDSILQGNNLGAPDGQLITALATREITWTRALFPYFDIDTWIDLTDATRHFNGMNAGVSGETTAQVLARVRVPSLLAPEIMIVSAGINSVVTGISSASIESDLRAICEYYLSRGIKVILSNIRLVGTEIIPDNSPQLTVRNDVNTWIEAFATSTPNLEFWNVAAAYDDGGGRPMPGYTADGIHPVSLGSQHAALSLIPIIRRLIEPTAQPMAPDADNFFPNRRLKGRGGRTGTGVTGRVAQGFSAEMISPGAKTIVMASILPNAETDGGSQEFRFSPHGGNSSEVFSLSLKAKSFDVAALAGKWVKARCKLTLRAWDGWRAINFNTTYMNWGSDTPETDEIAQKVDWNLDLETMPFKLPGVPASIAPTLWIYLHGDTATGTGMLQIQEFEFVEVDDPQTPPAVRPKLTGSN